MKSQDETIELFPIAVILVVIIGMFLFIVSCSQKKESPSSEREITYMEAHMFSYDIITNYLHSNNCPYPIISKSTNASNFLFIFENVFIPERYKKRVDWMPSGGTIFVYLTPINFSHPYDRYLKRGNSLDSLMELYDEAIGSFSMSVPTNYSRGYR